MYTHTPIYDTVQRLFDALSHYLQPNTTALRSLMAIKLRCLSLRRELPVFTTGERKLFHGFLVHLDTVSDLFALRDAAGERNQQIGTKRG